MNALTRKFESLRAKGQIQDSDVADLLGADPEAVARWDQGSEFPPAAAEKSLLEIEYIVDLLADFYEPAEAREWLFSPQSLLGGSTPADLIRRGDLDAVLRLAGQLREGAYL
jgi:antitoxin Xre/MbcA/ParS-like protein